MFENSNSEDEDSSESSEEECNSVDIIIRELSKRLPTFRRIRVGTRKPTPIVLKALKRLDSAGRIDLVNTGDVCIYYDVIVLCDDEQPETLYKASKILTVESSPSYRIREIVNVR